jgi:hypothetical protein
MTKISYRCHRFPPELIQHAVWLYYRSTLSFRDVEYLLAERGLDVSYETVRRWSHKFGPAYHGHIDPNGHVFRGAAVDRSRFALAVRGIGNSLTPYSWSAGRARGREQETPRRGGIYRGALGSLEFTWTKSRRVPMRLNGTIFLIFG